MPPELTQPAANEDRFLRRPSVENITGLSRSQIYRLMQQGRFPLAIPIGDRARAWSELAVRRWMRERMEGRAA